MIQCSYVTGRSGKYGAMPGVTMTTEIYNPYMLEGTTENKGGSHPVTWTLAHAKEPNVQLALVFVDSKRAAFFMQTLTKGITTGVTVSPMMGTLTFDNQTVARVLTQDSPHRLRGLRLDYSWIELGCRDEARELLSFATRGPDMQPWRRQPIRHTKRSAHGVSQFNFETATDVERVYHALTGNDWRGLLYVGKAVREALEQLIQVHRGEIRVGREGADACWEMCDQYPDRAACMAKCTGTELDQQIRPAPITPSYPTLGDEEY